jgi:hypothetical protein
MASPFEPRLQSILRNAVTPLLKGQRFIKSRSIYTKALDGVTWVINVQRSIYNTKDQMSFTLNCGISVPGVMEIYAGRKQPSIANVCIVSARIGMLAEQHLDTWWDMKPVEDSQDIDADIGIDIAHRLAEHCLPFLERFQTVSDVIDFLLSARCERDRPIDPQSDSIQFIYAGIILHLIGDSTRSEECFKAAAEAEARSRLEPIVPIIRSRIESA